MNAMPFQSDHEQRAVLTDGAMKRLCEGMTPDSPGYAEMRRYIGQVIDEMLIASDAYNMAKHTSALTVTLTTRTVNAMLYMLMRCMGMENLAETEDASDGAA